jgi:hypothetical protein
MGVPGSAYQRPGRQHRSQFFLTYQKLSPPGNYYVVILTADGKVLSTHPTGPSPISIVFDGIRLWVANSGSNTVTVYHPPLRSGMRRKRIRAVAPSQPAACGFPWQHNLVHALVGDISDICPLCTDDPID